MGGKRIPARHRRLLARAADRGARPLRGGHGALQARTPPGARAALRQDPELLVRLRLAHTLWLLGHPGEADRQRDLALQAAGESTHAYSRAVTWVWAAIVAMDRGEVAEFRRYALALAADPADEGPAQVLLATELFAGYLAVLDGRTGEGITRVLTVRARLAGRAPGARARPARRRHAPAARGLCDRRAAGPPGVALASEALGMGRGAELWEAEIRRLRATFLAALGAPAGEVEAELDRALAVARRQQARAFEERLRGTLAERSGSHGGAR